MKNANAVVYPKSRKKGKGERRKVGLFHFSLPAGPAQQARAMPSLACHFSPGLHGDALGLSDLYRHRRRGTRPRHLLGGLTWLFARQDPLRGDSPSDRSTLEWRSPVPTLRRLGAPCMPRFAPPSEIVEGSVAWQDLARQCQTRGVRQPDTRIKLDGGMKVWRDGRN
jgi:hypothetical protein